MPRIVPLLAVVLIASFSGCAHLHNQENATLANEVLNEFKTFQGSSVNVYAAMLDNHQKVEQKAAELQDVLARGKAESFSAQLHSTTWKEINEQLEVEKGKQQERTEQIKKEIANLLRERGVEAAKVDNVKQGLVDAQELLLKAVKEQREWKARQILFRSTIKFLAKAAAEDKKPSKEMREEFKKEILDKEITVVDVDDDGKITTKNMSIDKVLKDDIDNLKDIKLDGLLGKYTYNLFDPEAAPGLKVLMLSVGMDLAKIQVERAKLEVKYLAARIAVLRSQRAMKSNIKVGVQIIKNCNTEGHFVLNDNVLSTINQLRIKRTTTTDSEKRKIDNAIKDAFRVLAFYAVLKTLDESLRLELETRPAVLEHEYSIRLSAINGREHEALISWGLQGLAAYHEGGLTPEMIANFLRAAQTVALSVIAAGVI